MDHRTPKLAVLIDADNASDKIAAGLFEEIAKIGEASVRRIYGDFASTRLRGWTDVLPNYGLLPHQQFAYTTGKNASDIALVIDAMDLLHSARFDGFCLVSSDSDFTRLAARIREQGIDVYGFGEQKTPESFRQACHRFIYTENLIELLSQEQVEPTKAEVKKKLKEAVPLLLRALGQLEDDQGWAPLSALGSRLAIMAPDFDPRSFGFRKLSDLVRGTNKFDVEQANGGPLRIRSR